MTDFTYDIETYPNAFTCWFYDGETWWYFEISEFRNDIEAFIQFCDWLRINKHRMIGYNCVGFDYPVIHFILINGPTITYRDIYNEAMRIINTPWDDRFRNRIRDPFIQQVDLYLIKHFDNKAKSTRLKALEFALRMESIQDLPYPPGTTLTQPQVVELALYNQHDVKATHLFKRQCVEDFELRELLSHKYNVDMTNFNDAKIGSKIFEYELRMLGIDTYNKTPRDYIDLNHAILPSVQFYNPKFRELLTWLKQQIISETKGVFKDLSIKVDGFWFDFGTGGIHGCVKPCTVIADDEYDIVDVDVKSYYPNLSIKNNLYPQHLSEAFCVVYQKLFELRQQYPKSTHKLMNTAIKLALNATYGNSNSPYSFLYDPLFTMSITLNGQLLLCMLAEQVMAIPTCQMIQINTDGLTVKIRKDYRPYLSQACLWWEQYTHLSLEANEYQVMYIRDVNNYIAVHVNGERKLKGAYETDKEWHKDHSALIVPKVAEQVLCDGVDIDTAIRTWPDPYDFMLMGKAPQGSYLEINGEKQQSIMRYYVSRSGGELYKVMPPLPMKHEPRRIAQGKGWNVTECNDMRTFDWGNLQFQYYASEVHKLVDEIQGKIL